MHALLYLELQSRANAIRASLRRLREPRYAIGAAAMLAYLWFAFGRRTLRGDEASRATFGAFDALLSGDVAAPLLLAFIAGGWLLGGERAALPFSEAEVAWLFPAPLERRTLLHYRLLQSQLRSILGASFYALFTVGMERPFWQRCVGFWVVLSFHGLHTLAGAFTRQRLAAFGFGARPRSFAIGIGLAAVFGATWLSIGAGAPSQADFSLASFGRVLETPPLRWLLAPFRIVVAPLGAASTPEWSLSLAPALALIAVHYVWAMRAMVGFEEASAALAEKRAATAHALRSGRGLFALRERKARGEPFALAPSGRPELAFLWQRLIAIGRLSYPRSLLVLAGLAIAGTIWMLGAPGWEGRLRVVTIGAAFLAGYGLLLGPALMRGGLAQLFERIDLARSLPLRGWQVVLGELLGPILLLAAFEWTLVSVAAIGSATWIDDAPAALVLVAWGVAVALLGPLVGLLLGVQLGVQLALPAWFQPGSQRAGLEAGGLRLLFVFGTLLVFLVALVPASLVAAVAGAAAQLVAGSRAASLASGGAAAAGVMLAELALLLAWLGRRLESIDLANDLPR